MHAILLRAQGPSDIWCFSNCCLMYFVNFSIALGGGGELAPTGCIILAGGQSLQLSIQAHFYTESDLHILWHKNNIYIH